MPSSWTMRSCLLVPSLFFSLFMAGLLLGGQSSFGRARLALEVGLVGSFVFGAIVLILSFREGRRGVALRALVLPCAIAAAALTALCLWLITKPVTTSLTDAEGCGSMYDSNFKGTTRPQFERLACRSRIDRQEVLALTSLLAPLTALVGPAAVRSTSADRGR